MTEPEPPDWTGLGWTTLGPDDVIDETRGDHIPAALRGEPAWTIQDPLPTDSPLIEQCQDGCGPHLHRCRRCSHVSGPVVHTKDCPGCLYQAEESWTGLGVPDTGYSVEVTGELLPGGGIGGLTQTRTYYQHGRPAVAEHQPLDWSIGEAMAFLDPRPPRRTLSRWLAGMDPIGWRNLPQGGPPARTYPVKQIMVRHAQWRKNLGGTSGEIRG